MGTASATKTFIAMAAGAVLITSLSTAAIAETVLVTGSNRGIGLEFVKQYAEAGWTVIATSRSPADDEELQALAAADPDISIEALDVTDHAQVDALAEKLRGTSIDILVNNAGITGGPQFQNFGKIRYDSFADVMATNVEGVIKMTEAFFDHVAASETKKIVTITSSEGSIGMVNSGRQMFYRASKAAINMANRNIAESVRDSGVIVFGVNPGPTDTDMMAMARMPLRSAELAVTEMRAVIDGVTMEDTGIAFNYDGEPLPW